MYPTARARSALLILLLTVITVPSFAQSKRPVSLRLEPYCASPRSYSPILVTATLDPYVPQLLEGTLHLRFEDPGMKLLELRIPDIVLSGAPYTTTLVLPPMPNPTNKVIDVYAKFVTETREFGLGAPTGDAGEESYLSLLVAPSNQRGLTMAMVCEGSRFGRSPSMKFLGTALAIDKHSEQLQQQQSGTLTWGRFACTAPVVAPELLPADPLALCAFDVVVLSDGGLGKMTDAQLRGLLAWVRAGGSLCVVPDGGLEQRHANFLIELVGRDEGAPPIAVDANGDLVSDENLMELKRIGLGRAVVLASDEPFSESLDEATLRGLAGFLWKVRRYQLEKDKWSMASVRMPKIEATLPEWQRRRIMDQYVRAMEPATNVPISSSTLVNQLMPQNVRTVPLGLVATLLVVYVLIVGPVDYIVLGLLKLRRLTWVVFPIVTGLFTVAMVGISNYYMSTTETGGMVEIHDVVDAGVVVRRTRLDLEFFSARREVQHDRQNQFFVPVDVRTSLYDYAYPQGPYTINRPPQLNQPAEFSGDTTRLYYEGRTPTRYSTHRVVRQWEPQLTRTLEIVSEEAPQFGFDWDDPGDLWSHAGRQALSEAVMAHDDKVGLQLMNGGQRFVLRQLMLPKRREQEGPRDWIENTRDCFRFITQASGRATHFFRYVSQIAPNGGPNFEDLALLDESDTSQWLLMVSTLEGDTQQIYRRLYTQRPPEVRFGAEASEPLEPGSNPGLIVEGADDE